MMVLMTVSIEALLKVKSKVRSDPAAAPGTGAWGVSAGCWTGVVAGAAVGGGVVVPGGAVCGAA